MAKDSLADLTMLSIETEIIVNIINFNYNEVDNFIIIIHYNFNDKVTNKFFTRKERRIDFMFK